ncbi:MAG: hypothetical protein ACMUIE_02315 [Thermoplasmatota archaeon]
MDNEGPWTEEELSFLRKLDSPIKVQMFLSSIEYDSDTESRSPRYVMKERKAHCFEGALFTAACLRMLGHRPLLVDLRAVNDDDHVIAVYKVEGRWGAVAKSNFTTLRFREPVYGSLRELAMSYFDLYYNTIGQKTLREYSLPLDLSRFDDMEWMTSGEDLEYIGDELDRRKHFPLLSESMVKRLEIVEEDLMKAGLLGAKEEGLFKPKG